MIIGPQKTVSLGGLFSVTAGDGRIYNMKLPGTLDENNIGRRDTLDPGKGRTDRADTEENPLNRLLNEEETAAVPPSGSPAKEQRILTRLTRKYTCEGAVRISRLINGKETEGCRYFVEAERARVLSLFIDGREVPHFMPATLATPHVFEVTGLIRGSHMLSFVSDNSYPGLPREDILRSNMASDETVTNWNGILGGVRLREEKSNFIGRMNVRVREGKLSAFLEIYAREACRCSLRIVSDVLTQEYRKTVTLTGAYNTLAIDGLPCREDPALWGENRGNLHEFSAYLDGVEKTVPFGIRTLETGPDGSLLLNGRPLMLRAETCLSVFPETSYPPATEAAWEKILSLYRSYGVNCVRFASHCPPEAAFSAADRLGMLLMAELSCGPTKRPLSDSASRDYYRSELLQILRNYGNHPSFCFLALGDGLSPEEGDMPALRELLRLASSVDPDRLYSSGCGIFSGPEELKEAEDFLFARLKPGEFMNSSYPSSCGTFSDLIRNARETYKKPVFLYDVGQYESLPDLSEIDLFSGNLEPGLLMEIREKAEEQGTLSLWKNLVNKTGNLALFCKKEEIRAALRTPELSGVFLLGLQDDPGHGGRFHGVMNAHLQPGSFVTPKDFAEFFGPVTLQAELPGFTREDGEELAFPIRVLNFGEEDLAGDLRCTLLHGTEKDTLLFRDLVFPKGTVSEAGSASFTLRLRGETDERMRVILEFRKLRAEYPLWVFRQDLPLCPEEVYEADYPDTKVMDHLRSGGTVFLTPTALPEHLPGSVSLSFASGPSGLSGRIFDTAHPLFRHFIGAGEDDAVWWPMSFGRGVLLPKKLRTIVAPVPDPRDQRPLGCLFEFRCNGGNVLFSSLGLQEQIRYPEVRAFLRSIYSYLGSYEFSPVQELKPEEVRALFTGR